MDEVLSGLVEIVEAGRGKPTEESLHAAKRMLVDSIGCALGSYREAVPRIVREVTARRPKTGGVRVFGTDRRLQPDAAVFANGVMIRFLDYNDSYGSTVGIGHPSDYIPAAMAHLDDPEIPGATVLRAILVGYEIFARATDATGLGVERLDHVVSGTLAAAAAASVANGLTAAQTAHAMSLAVTANLATQATRLGDLSMWKGCAAGNATRGGVFAAELAAAGITGPDRPFTGRGGLAAVTGKDIDLGALTGEHPAIFDCHVKRFPSGYFSQGAIEAALAVREELAGRRPVAVEVGTFEFGKRVMAGDEQKWHPTTRETADHSIPYVVACALARGHVDPADLDESQLADPDIRRLLDVLAVHVDPECMLAWPEACMNRVTARLGDGSEVTKEVRYYRGHAKNPMTDAELEEKLAVQAAPLITDEERDALLRNIWTLDGAASIEGLFAWRAAEAAPVG
jgi:2-methylcitrate dehydratase